MIGLFDHAYGFAPEGRLNEALGVWRAAGFKVRDQLILHRGGKLSGFAMLTGTYLELLTVDDERAFDKLATATEHAQRDIAGPYALAAACRNASAVRSNMTASVPDIAQVDLRHVEAEVGSPPAWAIVDLPAVSTPGAVVSIIEYLRRGDTWATPTCGENCVYGIGGYYFCAEDCEQAVEMWASTFAPAIDDLRCERTSLQFGHQTLAWLSASEHASMFGVRPSATILGAGSLCAISLLSTNLERTATAFSAAGMAVFKVGDKRLATVRDPRTGYAFVVEAGPGPTQLADLINQRLSA